MNEMPTRIEISCSPDEIWAGLKLSFCMQRKVAARSILKTNASSKSLSEQNAKQRV